MNIEEITKRLEVVEKEFIRLSRKIEKVCKEVGTLDVQIRKRDSVSLTNKSAILDLAKQLNTQSLEIQLIKASLNQRGTADEECNKVND